MLLICVSCSAAYSVGAPKCPQCGGTEHVEQGSADHIAMLSAAKLPVGEDGPELVDLPAGATVASKKAAK